MIMENKTNGLIVLFALKNMHVIVKKEEIQQMLDDYRYAERLISEQYRELTNLLNEQE